MLTLEDGQPHSTDIYVLLRIHQYILRFLNIICSCGVSQSKRYKKYLACVRGTFSFWSGSFFWYPLLKIDNLCNVVMHLNGGYYPLCSTQIHRSRRRRSRWRHDDDGDDDEKGEINQFTSLSREIE